jgi:tripartite-type tricarboxylate transporter receptor subunit TctC
MRNRELKMPGKRTLGAIAVVLAFSLSSAAWAQEKYPSRPIRMIVALGPGSATDAMARILGEALRRELRTEVVVENKPGAAGIVGGEFVAKSKPDGYTLGALHASVLTTAAAITPNIPYDPTRDFTPLATVGVNPLVFAVSASSKWKSLEEFLDEAKKSRGKARCGLIGVGSHSHFNLELLKIASGADITHVPYSAGTGAVITGLLGNHIDCTSLIWPAVSAQVRAGKFRVLAVTSRIGEFPELPTFAAKGFPQASLEVFSGVFGPAGLPTQAQDKLVPALEKAIRDPHIAANLEKMGFSVIYERPRQLAQRIETELAVVRDVALKAGIKQE